MQELFFGGVFIRSGVLITGVFLREGYTYTHLKLNFTTSIEQNVLVVKTPRLPDELRNYQGPTLKAEVRVSSGRAGTCSAPLPFYYIPNGKHLDS
jgi:hypothetical protein